jgi:hypothetical protein
VDERLKKMERIRSVQEKLHRLAEWRLAALEREKRDLNLNEEQLMEALNRDDRLQGVFVEAMARRLAALARDVERVSRAREIQGRRLLEEGMKLKLVERMSARVQREYRKEFARRGFAALLETLAKPDDASLP